MLFRLFSGAGATGNVFFLKNGRTWDKGLAYSAFIGPKTTVAVVPTTPQILDFSVEARTLDKQSITVAGNLQVTLVPAAAVSGFDFTVNPRTGSYLAQWQRDLRTIAVTYVLPPIHNKARELDVEAAIRSHQSFEDAVRSGLSGANNPLNVKGITVGSCSIVKIEVDDNDVEEAIGAKERQLMLAAADDALHQRRLNGAENDRAVQTYEAATRLTLEKARTELIERQNENKRLEAQTDEETTRARLTPFSEIDAGKSLAAALMEMARGGRIGTLVIGPEILAALQR